MSTLYFQPLSCGKSRLIQKYTEIFEDLSVIRGEINLGEFEGNLKSSKKISDMNSISEACL
jgi:hypothetical protein